ncbi:protein Wnt-5b-like isoform X1 [Hydractinia symbiolongicarpus]|uniref:protein Wnt-5b-like isoform X1 n=1 Tax=Hydractinia symbiolongicarpus TaxID=13093 RepID=UPI0025513495|nr:protein Wnt-5b-like isoform X1 [Hydractinia symbiolongicarpus]
MKLLRIWVKLLFSMKYFITKAKKTKFWLFIYLFNLHTCFGQWWLYSRVIAETKKLNKQDQSMCYHFNLNDSQLKACLVDPNVLLLVGKGTTDGLAHCERQFVNERWNCSNNNFSNKLFKRRTPETAYVNAISSAGVINKLSIECDRGVLNSCGCRTATPHRRMWSKNDDEEPVYWSYCKDHLKYAIRTTRIFLDPSREETYIDGKKRSLKKLVLIQNNKASRKIAHELSKKHRKCSCYGTTGNCIAKTCYRWLPKLKVIGQKLYDKYKNAVKVKMKNMKKLVSAEPRRVLKKTDLVYTERINYCDVIQSLGIAGTQGRVCLNTKPKSGDDMTSCKILCCGRGYNPVRRKAKVRCRCTFKWCCDVKCHWCEKEVTEYRCK